MQCINATAAVHNIFASAAVCAAGGAPLFTAPIQAPWGCSNSAIGSDAVYCVSGAYTPPPTGINTFIYQPPDVCPAVGQPFYALATATGT